VALLAPPGHSWRNETGQTGTAIWRSHARRAVKFRSSCDSRHAQVAVSRDPLLTSPVIHRRWSSTASLRATPRPHASWRCCRRVRRASALSPIRRAIHGEWQPTSSTTRGVEAAETAIPVAHVQSDGQRWEPSVSVRHGQPPCAWASSPFLTGGPAKGTSRHRGLAFLGLSHPNLQRSEPSDYSLDRLLEDEARRFPLPNAVAFPPRRLILDLTRKPHFIACSVARISHRISWLSRGPARPRGSSASSWSRGCGSGVSPQRGVSPR
jgi:hypothetical protein